jgi:acyl dehydratase
MATEKLSSLSKLLFAGFLTAKKGVKIGNTDFKMSKIFGDVIIDKKNVAKYNEFFDMNDSLPLTYLYLLAFPSQLGVMTSKQFPISVMGLVHLGNTLEFKAVMDIEKPVRMETSALIPTKEEGSLFPIFNVNFFQGTTLVATCSSNYIAKRKRKSEKKADEEVLPEPEKRIPVHTENLTFTQSIAFKYARISGDFNPIHISPFLAKNFGFKSSIAHGWCSASRVFSIVEKYKKKDLKYITVNWKTPILLPGDVKLELYDNADGSTAFKVTNKKDELCLEGSVS